MTPERCDGIVLAAGAGTRYGMPKALAENGAWLHSAVRALREGGCDRVFVVLGATGPAQRDQTAHEPAWLISRTPRMPLPAGVHPVWASDWAIGLSASMRAGLAAVASLGTAKDSGSGSAPPEFAAVMPVDTPDVGPEVVARVLAAARGSESRLARAVFGKLPGHPVVLGRGHWAGVLATATGNTGAGTYLRERPDAVRVRCDDLATGIDQDYQSSTR
ncbi:NTP transferase domain-containing protein [Nocardia sp. NBC_01388]|uniref:nucleotidyltransferase family protein n=1 Tax=Nocardia sp. NBC_01388 TaxID=2903596 RepID=UPI003254FA7A